MAEDVAALTTGERENDAVLAELDNVLGLVARGFDAGAGSIKVFRCLGKC
jgi:hypothetical protein